ncbi:MAG: DUF3883 domain-containing protein [Bacteroidetes bacterium]|nr:DUF3883 domain-containing protein [Bacteroidota bacterium]
MSTQDIERKAESAVKKYEKKHGRETTPYRKTGMDMISSGKNTKRYIEVKGTKHSSKPITLTEKQYNNLRDKKNSYLYVVTDIGKNAKVNAIKGSDIGLIKNPKWEKTIRIKFQEIIKQKITK